MDIEANLFFIFIFFATINNLVVCLDLFLEVQCACLAHFLKSQHVFIKNIYINNWEMLV